MFGAALLAVHATAGALALLVGLIAYATRHTDRGSSALTAYFVAVIAVSATALGLVASDPGRLWWFTPLAGLTIALAVRGRRASSDPGPASARAERAGWGGSYIALVTSTLVVSVPGGVIVWIAPTLVGILLIERPWDRTVLAART